MVRRVVISFVILGLLYMIVHSYWAIGELDMRTYELKSYFEEIKVKHNKLTEIVRQYVEGSNDYSGEDN